MPLKTATQKYKKLSRIPAVLYRIPLPVTQVLVFFHGDIYPICPRCDCTLDREYANYCDRCGQHLSWEFLHFAKEIHAPRKER